MCCGSHGRNQYKKGCPSVGQSETILLSGQTTQRLAKTLYETFYFFFNYVRNQVSVYSWFLAESGVCQNVATKSEVITHNWFFDDSPQPEIDGIAKRIKKPIFCWWGRRQFEMRRKNQSRAQGDIYIGKGSTAPPDRFLHSLSKLLMLTMLFLRTTSLDLNYYQSNVLQNSSFQRQKPFSEHELYCLDASLESVH